MQLVTDGSDGSVMLCKDEQFENIVLQFVTAGNSGSAMLCKDEQFENIPLQFVTDGSDGSLASINAMHDANKYATSVTAPISKCDKSAYFNERHI